MTADFSGTGRRLAPESRVGFAGIHSNWMLKGSDKAFDELLWTVNEEIDYSMAPKKNIPALRKISEYLTPDEDDYL